MPFPIAAAVAAGATLASSALSNIGSGRRERKAREANVNFWEKQNVYNHPTQQMARLKEAGLNPNLIYGAGGSTAVGQAEQISPAKAAPYEVKDPIKEIGRYASMKSTEAQTDNYRTIMEQLQEQIDLLKTQNLNVQASTNKTIVETGNTAITGEILSQQARVAPGIQAGSLQALEANNRILKQTEAQAGIQTQILTDTQRAAVAKAHQEVKNLERMGEGIAKDNERKRIENALLNRGISPSSPWWVRGLGQNWKTIKQSFQKKADAKRKGTNKPFKIY